MSILEAKKTAFWAYTVSGRRFLERWRNPATGDDFPGNLFYFAYV